MPRWEPLSFKQNVTQTTLGDPVFAGLDTKTLDPSRIQQGYYATGGNVRLENGVLQTRPGLVTPPCHNPASGTIYGLGIFSDPFGVEWLLRAVSNGVYATRQGSASFFISLPTNVTISGPVEMVQAFSVVVLFQGPNIAPLYWNGQQSGNPQFGTLPPPLGPSVPIPNSISGEFFNASLIIPFGKDSIAFSDLGLYYQYNPNSRFFQIGSNRDDQLIRVFPWLQGQLLAFKQNSLYSFSNASGSLANVSLVQLSPTKGLVSRRAVAQVGSDVWWMDDSGVYSVVQEIAGSPQVTDVPLSDLIKQTIASINWNASAGIAAGSRRERVYFAVPIENSTRNNALLVYNLTSQSWESVDTFANTNFGIDDLYRTDWNGEKRLWAIDKVAGTVSMLEEGVTDLYGPSSSSEYQISTSFTTRGYYGPYQRNNFKRCTIEISTQNPNLTITANTDENAKAILCTNLTKNNTQYYTVGTQPWITTNTNFDHATPMRQDYILNLPFALGSTMNSGVQLDLLKSVSEKFPLRLYGRYCQININSSRGILRVSGAFTEDMEGQQGTKEGE